MGIIVIKKGREKSIRNQHPWIFSGAIERVEDDPAPGSIVTVLDHKGDFMARGYWNAKSQIQVRILTWQDEEIDESWWRKMLKRAIDARALENVIQQEYTKLGDNPSSQIAYRLINAENDYLPGLVVDRYADYLVLQALTLGIDQRKTMIAELLHSLLEIEGIYERSDVDVRHKEGLKSETGVLYGKEPPEYIEFSEHVATLFVDVRGGHKTGFYLDQAENRKYLVYLLSSVYGAEYPWRLLNLFSYTGGFGLPALTWNGIQVVNVDASRDSLELAEKIIELNIQQGHIKPDLGVSYELIQADVFQYLRDIAAEGQQYDIVILDPPKFAHNKQQVEKAARGYKDINLNAFKVIKPGGYLMTFSCSGAISRDLFQKIVFGALADSGRQAQIVRHLSASDDHPVALTFPEGEYLKGLLLRVY